MAEPFTTTPPSLTGTVNRQFFIEPLGGPKNPKSYLRTFPDAIYDKSDDALLVKFLYAILGPAGQGWLRRNYLEARLLIEEQGLELLDLDRFYGDPMRFGRMVEELYSEDPHGLLTQDEWEKIRNRDAQYSNRAIDFLNGVRAGNTPEGMHLVARSGLGHECEVIENYRYFYDGASDDPIGLPYFGQTLSTEEFIIIPRREVSRSEQQIISITGNEGPALGGTFRLVFNGEETTDIAYNQTRENIKLFLESLPSIQPGDVVLGGGPLPDTPITILFTQNLAYKNLPKLRSINQLTGGTDPQIIIDTTIGGVDSSDETIHIVDRDLYHLEQALDKIRPFDSIASVFYGPGLHAEHKWSSVHATSEYRQVDQFVTGRNDIPWSVNQWIEASKEKKGRIPKKHKGNHKAYYAISSIMTYTEDALTDVNYANNWSAASAQLYPNEHIGDFTQVQRSLFPMLNHNFDDQHKFEARDAISGSVANYSITAQTDDGVPLIDGLYPVEFTDFIPDKVKKQSLSQFWASRERPEGQDYLEIDLGAVQGVNYVCFQITEKPYNIALSYDILDLAPRREWREVIYKHHATLAVGYDRFKKWREIKIPCVTKKNDLLFTRYLRLTFTKRSNEISPFHLPNDTLLPFSVEVRNLRVGRRVAWDKTK